MPNIKINIEEFRKLLGTDIDEEELHEKASYLGAHWNHVEGKKWDVETYPNRPDLLSVEGLARAYRGFFDLETGREDYRVEEREIGVKVKDSVKDVRPFIGAAVIRDIELTDRIINGMIQLQEKMHETFGRRRDKIAIGLHDMEEIEPPFTYRAVEPEKVSFKPLEYDRNMQLGEILDEHEKGQEYAWILEDEDHYPVIQDSKDQILSFPPIINNQLTEVDQGTTDIFIDVTGKDRRTVQKALNILATAFAERGGTIEKVEVAGEMMPDLQPERKTVDMEYFRSTSGLDLEPSEVIRRLERMRYGAERSKGELEVQVPSYRTDVMHSYDIIEDAVIAHGYDDVDPVMPNLDTTGGEKSLSQFEGDLRDIMTGFGALEANTYILSNEQKLYERMETEKKDTAEMSNPLTEDYTMVRSWMLPSLMQALKENRHHPYPQNFFEVGDVVRPDNSAEGASNRRKLAYVAAGEVDYNDVRGLLQVLERDLGLDLEVRGSRHDSLEFDRSAVIESEDEEIGFMGEVSEEVRDNWDIETEVVALELDLEKIR